MLNHNFLTYTGKIFVQILGEIFYFPLWWYSVGLVRLVRAGLRFLADQEAILGLGVWIKNVFVPMYGQSDFAGRLISLIIRLIQIIFRGIAFLFWIAAALLVLVLWLILPFALISALAFQLS